MRESPEPPSRKRKRRNRLPHAGPPLVPFCAQVARGLRDEMSGEPTALERRSVERFLAAFAAARTAETEYRHGKLQVLALGARLRKRRNELHDALEQIDLVVCARHGSRSPELWKYGLPPNRKRGPKGPRNR